MRNSLIIFAMLISLTATLTSKRVAYKPVAPVISNGIRYEAPPFPLGVLIAVDDKSRKELWRIHVYHVKIIKGLERDVQWRHVKKMSLKGDILTVINEKDFVYEVNIKTKQVKVLKGKRNFDWCDSLDGRREIVHCKNVKYEKKKQPMKKKQPEKDSGSACGLSFI